jgi:hypothetical protein
MTGQNAKPAPLPACQQHGDAAFLSQHIHHSLRFVMDKHDVFQPLSIVYPSKNAVSCHLTVKLRAFFLLLLV